MEVSAALQKASGLCHGAVPPQSRLIALLSEGHFAQVFMAEHSAHNFRLAFKVIDKTKFAATINRSLSSLNITDEYRVHRSCEHPYIVSCFDYFDSPSHTCLMLELLEHDLMHYMLEQRCCLQQSALQTFAVHIWGALTYLHMKGIAHRDIKLENVLYSCDSGLLPSIFKLGDFGLAKECQLLSGCKTLIGTLEYMASEVVEEKYDARAYGQQADVWSFGISLFMVATNLAPYEDESKEKLLSKVRNGKVDMSPSLLNTLDSWVVRCLRSVLERDASRRAQCIALDNAVALDVKSLFCNA